MQAEHCSPQPVFALSAKLCSPQSPRAIDGYNTTHVASGPSDQQRGSRTFSSSRYL